MDSKQYQGRTAAEAAIRACEALNLTRSELKYDIVDDVGEGLQRKVTIAVHAAPAAKTPPSSERPVASASREPQEQPREAREPRGDAGRRSPRRGREARPRNDEPTTTLYTGTSPARGAGESDFEAHDAAFEKPREPRQGRAPSRRPHRPTASVAAPASAPAPVAAPVPTADGPSRGRRGRNEPRGPRSPRGQGGSGGGIDSLLHLSEDFGEIPVMPAVPAANKRAEQAVVILSKIVELMKLNVQATLVAQDEAEIHVHLRGPDESRAIGQRGEVLLALQFVGNRILSRQLGDQEVENSDEVEQLLVVDAGGHRQKRKMAIEKMAKTLAERSLQEGKAVRLSPMSASDRRVVHMALQEMTTVSTRSEGDGALRSLLILPAAFAG